MPSPTAEQAQEQQQQQHQQQQQQQSLLGSTKVIQKLYDQEIMLEIDPSIAGGFVSLLGGVPSANAAPAADINLSFLALTEGNVLDACFGVQNASARRTKDTVASKKSKQGKEILADAAYVNDDFKTIAVAGYRDAFRAVVAYHKEMSKLNCFTACIKSGKIRKKAMANLKVALLAVAEAVEETP